MKSYKHELCAAPVHLMFSCNLYEDLNLLGEDPWATSEHPAHRPSSASGMT